MKFRISDTAIYVTTVVGYLLLVVSLNCCHAVAQQQQSSVSVLCNNETEHHFEFQCFLTQDEIYRLRWDVRYVSNNTQMIVKRNRYGRPTCDKSVEGCIPKDVCAVFTIQGLMTDQFRFRLDGKELPSDAYDALRFGSIPEAYYPQIPLFTAVLAADNDACVPICAEDETLFELDARIGGSARLDWRLENEEGHVMTRCEKQDNSDDPSSPARCSYEMHHQYFSRYCLPTAGCYRFIAFSDNPIWDFESEFPILKVAFGGELVGSLREFKTKVFEFGECQSCDGSVFESLMFADLWCRGADGCEGHTFAIAPYQLSQNGEILLKGAIEEPERLQYVRQCIPSDACLTFQINQTSQYYLQHLFVSIDGVFHRAGSVRFRRVENVSQSLLLGSCGDADCSGEDETLVDIQIDIGSQRPDSIWWQIRGGGTTRAHQSEIFDSMGYELNRTYRQFECILSKECSRFSIFERMDDGEAPSTTILQLAVGGYKLQWIPQRLRDFHRGMVPLTAYCEADDGPLSSLEIAIAVVGSILGILTLVLVVYSQRSKISISVRF